MRKLATVFGIGVTLVLIGVAGSAYFLAQRADYGWRPRIAQPTFTTEHPRVLVDEGHHNASSIGFAGRYWPFGRLLRADGYLVERFAQPMTPTVLAGARVLVIANASGAPKPQLFGLNLPSFTAKKRSDPAFTSAEIDVIRGWVEQGGALLLIADHAPFGQSVSALASALGITMHQGFVEVPGERSDPLLFSEANGRLGQHPIIAGDGVSPAVSRVMTYTGQSLDGPPNATVLLRLPETAREAVPTNSDELAERAAGSAQGLAFSLGKGRVVCLGEGGMVTAQVNRSEHYGINDASNDNQQFVLNVMRWLVGKL
jgi:hypothetical protein